LSFGFGREPYYSTVYQQARFGCSSSYLPGSDFAPEYWGPRSSLEVQNWPRESAAAREDVRWFRSLGEPSRDGKTAEGEVEVFLGFDGYRSGIPGRRDLRRRATAERTAAELGQLGRIG
jgi:hypothetical protein